MPLPGVKTTIEDQFYNQSRTDLPGGPLLTVVACRGNTATADAPDLTPYLATSEKDVISSFGEDSQIHKAYFEVTTSGAPQVALVALPSDTSFDQTNGQITSATLSDYSGDELFEAAVAAAETVRTDILYLWGRGTDSTDWDDAEVATPGNDDTDYFYADNSSTSSKSWAVKLADACHTVTVNSHPMIGVIGTKGILGYETPTPGQVATGVALPNLVDRETLVPAVGHLISVVLGEVHLLGAPSSWGWQSAASSYAASIARLDVWSSTTGKPVYNVDAMRYNPTRPQLESITGLGVVPIQEDMLRVLRWVDGTTFSTATSDYARLTTVRIVFDTVKLVHQISQGYIGEAMSIERQQAFSTQITSALQSMQRLGALLSSDFRVIYAPSENKASVDLALIPAFELREVFISVSVNF